MRTISRLPASRLGNHKVEDISRLICLLQCIEQHLGFLPTGGIKPLGEPAVERHQELGNPFCEIQGSQVALIL